MDSLFTVINRGCLTSVTVAKAILFTLCVQTSCSQAPNLKVNFENFVPLKEHIKKADLIVVGTLAAERLVRIIGPKDNAYELREVSINMEGVLRGNINETHFSYYYYMPIGGWNGPAFNISTPGERAIFYLMKDAGVWRAVTDGYQSHTPIYTGKHEISAASRSNLNETIAQLLLSPSEDRDLSEYFIHFRESCTAAFQLTGEPEEARILQTLRTHHNRKIRVLACIHLAAFGERDCLAEALTNDQLSKEDRRLGEEYLDMHLQPRTAQ